MRCGKVEDCKALGEVDFGALSVGSVVGVKNGGDISGHFAFEVLFSNVLLGVLLELKLATLPSDGAEAGSEGGAQAAVSI